jgi:cytochrome b6-f complex iron-sulfur subunit
MDRRIFFRNFAIGGSLLLTAPALFNACSNDSADNGNTNIPSGGITIDLTDPAYSALKTVGGFAYKDNIIVIRSTDTVYLALSKVCTHESCTVAYNASTMELPCPCHGSKFNSAGGVINGPAARPLKKYNVSQSGNTLTIS